MPVLVYRKKKAHAGTLRSHFLRWRKDKGKPIRCDRPECKFYIEPLVWNG